MEDGDRFHLFSAHLTCFQNHPVNTIVDENTKRANEDHEIGSHIDAALRPRQVSHATVPPQAQIRATRRGMREAYVCCSMCFVTSVRMSSGPGRGLLGLGSLEVM